MRISILIALLTLSACLKPGERQNRAQIVSSMATTLEKQYPGVPATTKAKLPSQAILVDLRGENERAISTLQGAITKNEFEENAKQYEGHKIVAFDTIGQRSIPWVSEQRANGFDAVNLRGGILAWAHDGGTFIDQQGKETKRVHVYSEAWDMLPDGFQAITTTP